LACAPAEPAYRRCVRLCAARSAFPADADRSSNQYCRVVEQRSNSSHGFRGSMPIQLNFTTDHLMQLYAFILELEVSVFIGVNPWPEFTYLLPTHTRYSKRPAWLLPTLDARGSSTLNLQLWLLVPSRSRLPRSTQSPGAQ